MIQTGGSANNNGSNSMRDEITTSEKIVMALAIPVAILAAIGAGLLLLMGISWLTGDLTPFKLSTF
jgi:hypothetical protein